MKKFEVRHNKAPEVILICDDGDEHAYDSHPTASKRHVIICDEDGDNLDMYRTIPSQVGGAGVLVLRGDESVAKLALAAGAVGASFDAEAFAAILAFQEISELAITRGSTVRWFTDGRSCIDALNGQPRKYGDMMRKLQYGIVSRTSCRAKST